MNLTTKVGLSAAALVGWSTAAHAVTLSGIDFVPECTAPCVDTYDLSNDVTRNDTPQLFDLGDMTLGTDLSVEAITPAASTLGANWDYLTNRETLLLETGETFHVYLFHFDSATSGPLGDGIFARQLEMLFDDPVVGVIVDGTSLMTADPELVPDHITVDSFGSNRGLELNGLPFGPNDFLTFESDSEIHSSQLRNRAGYDQAFILTQASLSPEVVITGACPGRATFTFSGFTPGGPIEFASSRTTGSSTIGRTHPCGNLQSDLGSVARVRLQLTADANGEAVFQRAFSNTGVCSANMQALDVTTCTFSPVAVGIPSAP
jgi:hypothetical protein